MRRLLIGITLLGVAACSDHVTQPFFTVSGAWTVVRPDNTFILTLSETGTQVTGTGTYFRNINPSTGTMTAVGEFVAPHLTMTVTDDQGNVFMFAGDVRDTDHIPGIETVAGVGSDSLTLIRLSTP